ncbi:MAG: hypothetical protein GXX82_12165 [Syntrophorhabdus sp.]|nr:hypothetical protein [Syntrophorhabdus sp.]
MAARRTLSSPVPITGSTTTRISPWLWRFFIIAAACYLFLSLTACGVLSRNAEINAFVGRPMQDLIQARGNPDRWETDGKGNRVLVYEWTWESTYETPGRAWRDASGLRWTNPKTETILHRGKRAYYVNKQGIVFDGKWAW